VAFTVAQLRKSASAAPGSNNEGINIEFIAGHGDGYGDGGRINFYAGHGGYYAKATMAATAAT
jgi:hypothetical protein